MSCNSIHIFDLNIYRVFKYVFYFKSIWILQTLSFYLKKKNIIWYQVHQRTSFGAIYQTTIIQWRGSHRRVARQQRLIQTLRRQGRQGQGQRPLDTIQPSPDGLIIIRRSHESPITGITRRPPPPPLSQQPPPPINRDRGQPRRPETMCPTSATLHTTQLALFEGRFSSSKEEWVCFFFYIYLINNLQKNNVRVFCFSNSICGGLEIKGCTRAIQRR